MSMAVHLRLGVFSYFHSFALVSAVFASILVRMLSTRAVVVERIWEFVNLNAYDSNKIIRFDFLFVLS